MTMRCTLIVLLAVLSGLPRGASAQERAYVTSSDQQLTVVDIESRSVVDATVLPEYPSSIAVSPNGERLYVSTLNRDRVWVIQAASLRIVGTIFIEGEIRAIELTPDGATLYVTRTDRDTVAVVDTTTLQVQEELVVGQRPFGLAFHGPSGRLYVANADSEDVTVVDTLGGTVLATIRVGLNPQNLEVSPDGSRLVVINAGETFVSVIDTETLGVIGSIPIGPTLTSAAVSPDGGLVWVSSFFEAAVVDLESLAVVDRVEGLQQPWEIDMTSDGRWVVAVNVGRDDVSIIDAAKFEIVANVPVGSTPFMNGDFIGVAPPPLEPAVPSLSSWGILLLCLLLASSALVVLGRR